MPGEKQVFTRASILFRPHEPRAAALGGLVEAPGTAPGSASLIAQAVYRHSRLTGIDNIERFAANSKRTRD